MKSIFLFLDTNIFLHYKIFTNIPWNKITNADSVSLILAPVIARELDEQKFKNNLSHLRSRAKKVLSSINKLLETNLEVSIKTNLSLRYLIDEPSKDIFDEHNLKPEINDDRLLASIIQFKNQNPNLKTALISADLGPGLKAKTKLIEVIKLDEIYLVRDEQDIFKKKIDELNKEIISLKYKLPELNVLLVNGDIKQTFKISDKVSLNEDAIKRRLEKLRILEDKIIFKKQELKDISNFSAVMAAAINPFSGISEKRLEYFNHDYDKFLNNYKVYLEELMLYKTILGMTAKLDFVLVNSGRIPGENIDIFFHFPDGVVLFSEEDYGSKPNRPNLPTLLSDMEIFRSSINFRLPYINSINRQFSQPTITNVKLVQVKKTNSYDVKMNIKYLKHNQEITLETLYCVFESYENAKGFQIDYKIHAANFPKEIIGKLNIIVDKIDNIA